MFRKRTGLAAQAFAADRKAGQNPTRRSSLSAAGGNIIRPRLAERRLALQLLVALAVIAAALLDPLHAAIAVGGLVGVVLIDTGMHPGLAGGLLGIFRIDGGWEHGGPRRRWGGCGRRLRRGSRLGLHRLRRGNRRGGGRRRGVGSALG